MTKDEIEAKFDEYFEKKMKIIRPDQFAYTELAYNYEGDTESCILLPDGSYANPTKVKYKPKYTQCSECKRDVTKQPIIRYNIKKGSASCNVCNQRTKKYPIIQE